MVIDDAPDIRRLFDLVLSISGYSVVLSASGAEALRRLGQEPLPDVVILDVEMPELDGWETLKRLRADPTTKHLPVILCTVRNMVDDNLRAWTLGCDGYVTKPLDPDALVSQVRQVLSRDPAQRSTLREKRISHLSGS